MNLFIWKYTFSINNSKILFSVIYSNIGVSKTREERGDFLGLKKKNGDSIKFFLLLLLKLSECLVLWAILIS